MMKSHLTLGLWIGLMISYALSSYAQLPAGMIDELYTSGWNHPVGFTFDEQGRLYVWERFGRVYVTENGSSPGSLLIDISEEVAVWNDHGLLGFALHPNFLSNGWFYLYYTVEREHLLHYGSPDFNPDTSLIKQATIARVCRYTADPASQFQTVIPESRKVLIGESIDTGIPLLFKSHGVGALVFGTDGSLMVSIGDAAAYGGVDNGGDDFGSYAPQGLSDGIIQPYEDVGGYRSQLVQSHSGKLLRIDSETGDGLPGNPFYDPASPRSPASRLWALGFRNPFRFCLQPGTGSHDPEDGNPGTFWLGDYGWARWEELNIIDGPGQNFGWPIYEGFDKTNYNQHPAQNLTAPNPLGNQVECEAYFSFDDLLLNYKGIPNPRFANPCDKSQDIPADIPLFVHQWPVFAFNNQGGNKRNTPYVPTINSDGNPQPISALHPNSPVGLADTMRGSGAISGLFYSGTQFPEEYQGDFFLGDYSGWVYRFHLDSLSQIDSVSLFSNNGDFMVQIMEHPLDGCIYYLNYKNFSIRRICYGGNARPTARIEADHYYGASPLIVQFDGTLSEDPEGALLSYHWDFGDGVTSTEAHPNHAFTAPDSNPHSYQVVLTVRDTGLLEHKDSLLVSLNNKPPEVRILNVPAFYSLSGYTDLKLTAEVFDPEHESDELSYAWQAFLHHNSHYHPEPIDPHPESQIILSPEGCGAETYYYRIRLSVKDAVGLVGFDEKEIHPWCGPLLTELFRFELEAKPEHIDLLWQSTRETSGTTFEVQRSADGHFFEGIARINPIGSGFYLYTDLMPVWGENYYRIATVREDGLKEYSAIASALFPPLPAIEIFPNPIQETLFIRFHEKAAISTVQIWDLQGREVFFKEWKGLSAGSLQEIDMSGLNNGLYLCLVFADQVQLRTKLYKFP